MATPDRDSFRNNGHSLQFYTNSHSLVLYDKVQDHSAADEHFYLTANMMLNIAKRAKDIFVSSEVEEKRQFLGFLLQNCMLDGKNLEFSMVSPFNLIAQYHDDITLRATRV